MPCSSSNASSRTSSPARNRLALALSRKCRRSASRVTAGTSAEEFLRPTWSSGMTPCPSAVATRRGQSTAAHASWLTGLPRVPCREPGGQRTAVAPFRERARGRTWRVRQRSVRETRGPGPMKSRTQPDRDSRGMGSIELTCRVRRAVRGCCGRARRRVDSRCDRPVRDPRRILPAGGCSHRRG